MLTPQEVSGKEFVKAVFGGYDMSVVDDFLETLTADYSTLYKENAILKSKIKVLVEKVEEYRSTEDAMRMALLTAQRLGDEITAEAKKKSDELLSQTEDDIRDRLLEMKNKFVDENSRLQSIKDETRRFITASQEIMRQHATFLTKVEEMGREQAAAPAAAPEPQEPAVPSTDRPFDRESPREPEMTSEDALSDDDGLTGEDAEPEWTQAAEKPAVLSREEDISDTARQIDDAIFKITDEEADPFGPLFREEENAKVFRPKQAGDKPDDDEPTSPRPKFDFNNLKFGPNYSGD